MTDPAASNPVQVFDTALDLQLVAVSPDGKVIVGSDGTVWEAAGVTQPLHHLRLNPGELRP